MDMSDKSLEVQFQMSSSTIKMKTYSCIKCTYIRSVLSCRFSHFGKIKWDEPGKLWGLGRLFITGANFLMNKTKNNNKQK